MLNMTHALRAGLACQLNTRDGAGMQAVLYLRLCVRHELCPESLLCGPPAQQQGLTCSGRDHGVLSLYWAEEQC